MPACPAWSPEDLATAVRAYELYEKQVRHIMLSEYPDWPKGTGETWRARVIRAIQSDRELPEPRPLRIDTEPEAVYREIIANATMKTVVPSCLQDYREDDADHSRPTADPELLRVERSLLAAQDTIRDLKSKLRAAYKEESLSERIASLIEDAAEPLPRVKKKAGGPARKGGHEVDAILMLGDEHADEVVSRAGTWGLERYNFEVFRLRSEILAEKVVGFLTEYLPANNFGRLVIAKLGDSINGSIHDAEYRNHFGNSIHAAIATGDVQAHMIQWIHEQTGLPIDVVCVSGNHPRTTKYKDFDDPHANLDFLVASQIATRLQDEPEIAVYAPRAYTAFFDLRGHLFAMNHGDDVRGSYAGIPWYGFTRKNTKVQAMLSSVGEKVGYFLYGHYHTPAEVPTAGAMSIHNGAFPATDEYAINAVSGAGRPMQKLLVVEEANGVILPIPLYIKDSERESGLWTGETECSFGGETILDEIIPEDTEGKLQVFGRD